MRSCGASRRPQSPGVDFLWWTASLRPGPAQVPLRSGQRRKPKLAPPPLRDSPPCPRPRPPRPHRATPACAAASQASSTYVLRPRRPIPTASCLPAPAPAARPPQPRPPADAPPIGLRAGPPDRRLRARHFALIGDHTGEGGARESTVMSKAKPCSSAAGGTMLPYSGRAFGPGRGLRTRELCAGWGLGSGEFLVLLFALACREDSVLDPTSEQLEDSALDWTLERGWALRKPWAGLWHMGGPQPTAWL